MTMFMLLHFPYLMDIYSIPLLDLTAGQGELAQLAGLVWVLGNRVGHWETPKDSYKCVEPKGEYEI